MNLPDSDCSPSSFYLPHPSHSSSDVIQMVRFVAGTGQATSQYRHLDPHVQTACYDGSWSDSYCSFSTPGWMGQTYSEANLLRLLEKVTNGTVIEISYTGAHALHFSLGQQTL